MKIQLSIAVAFFLTHFCYAQDTTGLNKVVVKYQANLNFTFDRNIVQRLLLISANRFSIESKKNMIEPTLNYRFGHITPNGRPKTNLENDLFIQLENHFLKHLPVFPSVIIGFENSPNFRELNYRWVGGAGMGLFLLKKPNNFLHLNLYGTYETSNFKALNYTTFRLFPSIKGNIVSNKHRIGVIYSASFGQSASDIQNYRARAAIKPFFKFSKTFELNFMYDIWYENIVNGESPKEISTFAFGIVISNN